MRLYINLDGHFENFIEELVSSGKYSSTSEVMMAALGLLEEQESKKKFLKSALSAGEKSGFDKSFDPKTHLKNLKNNRLLS
jgi:antitoxin ParD1/3/4